MFFVNPGGERERRDDFHRKDEGDDRTSNDWRRKDDRASSDRSFRRGEGEDPMMKCLLFYRIEAWILIFSVDINFVIYQQTNGTSTGREAIREVTTTGTTTVLTVGKTRMAMQTETEVSNHVLVK